MPRCFPSVLFVGVSWELVFSLVFFPGILKPSESQVVTFAVVGLQTSVKNRFLNVILFTTKDATNH